LPGERDNARNNARCTQARKTTHGLDGQHQHVDRTLRGRVNQNDRRQGQMEKVRPWCGQPTDQGRLKNRTALALGRLLAEVQYVEPVLSSFLIRSFIILFFLLLEETFPSVANQLNFFSAKTGLGLQIPVSSC